MRPAYSLRHTYVRCRLAAGADIDQPAQHCRTSLKMIEPFYAVHISASIDAGAINLNAPSRWRRAGSSAATA